jgi:hypothetical protein
LLAKPPTEELGPLVGRTSSYTKERPMDCAVDGCKHPAVTTYTYIGDLKPGPSGGKVIASVPLCQLHAKNQPRTLNLR